MKSGFTLVELLVAIAIFGMIAAAATANLRGNNPDRQLRSQVNNFASFLRQAQVQSMSGEPFAGSVPVGGYGVYVEQCAVPPCQATLFADQNANFLMEEPAEVVQTISFGSELTINAVSTGNPSVFLFRPPAGSVCFNNICSDAGVAQITVGARGTDAERVITINQVSGQISS
jgi:prepilin-type N-terminal cleavage/methylation domain-containing protein